jgi:hypothetical protein
MLSILLLTFSQKTGWAVGIIKRNIKTELIEALFSLITRFLNT